VGGNVYVGQNLVVYGNSAISRDLGITGNIKAQSITVDDKAFVSTLYGNVVSKNLVIPEEGTFACNGLFSVKSFVVNSNIESTSATTGALQIGADWE
jgi:hypothetical protein